MSPPSRSSVVVRVRKYANRKMYDEERSAYLSMLDLSDLVARGKEVQVVCDLTGNDLTVECLARALYERLKVRNPEKSTIESSQIAELIRQVSRRGG